MLQLSRRRGRSDAAKRLEQSQPRFNRKNTATYSIPFLHQWSTTTMPTKIRYGGLQQNPYPRRREAGLADMAAIGRSNLSASQRLFFIGVFCRILDFLTSLFDLLPGFFYRLIDLLAGALHGALFFLTGE
jgi:hypothetical protein